MSIGGPVPDDWNPAAASEGKTDFNGVFSWAGESHAFTIGFGVGLTGEQSMMVGFAGYAVAGAKSQFEVSKDAHIRQVATEPAYALGGMVLGYIANLVSLGKPIHEYLLALLAAAGVA